MNSLPAKTNWNASMSPLLSIKRQDFRTSWGDSHPLTRGHHKTSQVSLHRTASEWARDSSVGPYLWERLVLPHSRALGFRSFDTPGAAVSGEHNRPPIALELTLLSVPSHSNFASSSSSSSSSSSLTGAHSSSSPPTKRLSDISRLGGGGACDGLISKYPFLCTLGLAIEGCGVGWATEAARSDGAVLPLLEAASSSGAVAFFPPRCLRIF